MNVVALHTDFRIYWPARLRALSEALKKRGDKLTVIEIAGKGSPYAFANQEANNDIDWKILYPESKPEELSGKGIKAKLFSMLDDIKPDAIICGAIAFPSGALAVQYGQKTGARVLSFDDSKVEAVKRNKLVEFVKKCVYRGIDAMLYPAEPWQATGYYWGFNNEQMFYGVDVVDNNFWNQHSGKAIIEGDYFVCVGRQLKRKHFGEVIDSYSLFRDKHKESKLSLLLVGDGPENANIKDKVENSVHKDSIKLLPFMPQDKLVNIYRHATALVVNSDLETWGLVMNEAMAAGCPVIASEECGATACLVKDSENGFVFKSCDNERLANIMADIDKMSDKDRARLKTNALQTISRWGLDKFVEGAVGAIDYTTARSKSKPNILQKRIIALWHGQYNPV